MFLAVVGHVPNVSAIGIESEEFLSERSCQCGDREEPPSRRLRSDDARKAFDDLFKF
jgi:hypothetical protein